MNEPNVKINHNAKQASRCVDAALRWAQGRKDEKDTEYTLSVLVSLLQEAKAALVEES